MRRLAIATLVPVVLALTSREAAAAPLPATNTVVRVAADTAFKPEGSYSLNLTIEGQPTAMSFTVDKKADGTYFGVFKHAEMGDFATTSFKLEGRKMTVTVETPGGPASVMLTVAADNTVDGEWTMTGDGSKVSGKKNS